MAIYYFGEYVGEFTNTPKETQTEQSPESVPMLVGDIVKNRPDYKKYMERQTQKKKFVIRHYQEGVMS